MSKKLIIKNGSKFGKLTVINEVERMRLPSGQINRVFKCRCECGNITNVRLVHLARNRTLTCGCSVTCSGKPKHHKSKTRLYTIWRGIKNRTSSANYIDANIYYNRNITICDEWKNDFELFYNWSIKNGYKDGLQIDRINNDKGYFPDNCRYCTPIEQANNKRNTIMVKYNGIVQPLSPLLREKNMYKHKNTIIRRIKKGMDSQSAIDMKIRKGNYGKHNKIN